MFLVQMSIFLSLPAVLYLNRTSQNLPEHSSTEITSWCRCQYDAWRRVGPQAIVPRGLFHQHCHMLHVDRANGSGSHSTRTQHPFLDVMTNSHLVTDQVGDRRHKHQGDGDFLTHIVCFVITFGAFLYS